MALFAQTAGPLDVELVVGDEVNVAVNLGVNVTGYTFQSIVYVARTLGGGGAGLVTTVGATAATPAVTVVNATTGSLIWSLNETQTGSLNPNFTYRWYLRWVTAGSEMTRTVLGGQVIARAPGA